MKRRREKGERKEKKERETNFKDILWLYKLATAKFGGIL